MMENTMLQTLTKFEETLENMREEITNDHITISSQMESKVKNVGSILRDLSFLMKEKKERRNDGSRKRVG